MTTKILLYALLFFPMIMQSQTADKIILKDYGILTNDITVIKEKTIDYSKIDDVFKESFLEVFEFDSSGYITSATYNNDPKSFRSYSYDAKHSKRKIIFVDSKKEFNDNIEKLPQGMISIAVDKYKITRNPNGSVKQLSYTGKDENSHFDYTYDKNVILILPSVSYFNKYRVSNDGLLLSEENLFNHYYSYDSKSKLLSQKISAVKKGSSNIYFAYIYEFDNRGNWIVQYEVASIPEYGTIGNNLKSIKIRELTYKDKTKTGVNTITNAIKNKGLQIPSNLNVTKINLTDYYSYPVFIDFDLKKLTNSTAAANSKCQGDCQDGWGSYTYENGNYEGFWSNGKKSGYGQYTWNNGEIYSGNWYNDQMNGYGQSTFSSKNEYLGGFKDGKNSGFGMYYNHTTKSNSYGKYEDGRVISKITLDNNGKSTGCTSGNCENGYGTMIFENGSIFIGHFINKGFYMGIYSFKNGDLYQGTFDYTNSQFSGYGTYFFKGSGDSYQGNWASGNQDGRGLFYSKSKNAFFKQKWKDGKVIKLF